MEAPFEALEHPATKHRHVRSSQHILKKGSTSAICKIAILKSFNTTQVNIAFLGLIVLFRGLQFFSSSVQSSDRHGLKTRITLAYLEIAHSEFLSIIQVSIAFVGFVFFGVGRVVSDVLLPLSAGLAASI